MAEKGKRLPLKKDLKSGEKPNITELTAIARIREGEYPKSRLQKEIDRESEGEKLWLSTQNVPGTDPPMTWLAHLKALGDEATMTWLQHFKVVLEWAHEHRQSEIRKMVTIHYARWVILEPPPEHEDVSNKTKDVLPGIDGPHVLFTSNFDGLMAGYLEDFAAVDELPLNLIFGHCMGWPGARPADRFIQYVKDHQIPANVFYANYPKATVSEVNRALEWKGKTEVFIKKMRGMKGKPVEEWEKAASDYLNDLAKPTPKDEEFPK